MKHNLHSPQTTLNRLRTLRMTMGTSSCLLLILVTLSASLIPRAHSLLSEVKALAVWKQSIIDPNNELKDWDPTVPGISNPCAWAFVTCNNQYKVKQVVMINSMLSGHLVPELGLLSDLEILVLASNNFIGTIPPELGNLKKLWELQLMKNSFSGKIPHEISTLPFLHIADFSHNGQLCWDFWPTEKFVGSYPLCQKSTP